MALGSRLVLLVVFKVLDLGLDLGVVLICQLDKPRGFVDALREQLLAIIKLRFGLILDLLSALLQINLGLLNDFKDFLSRLRFDCIEALFKSGELFADTKILAATFLLKALVANL